MEIVTQIDIRAPRERVWAILTDFSLFPAWNPFGRQATGELRVGGRLSVVLQTEGGRPLGFRPRVIRLVPNEELVWFGSLGVRGLFGGEHSFGLTDIPGGTRFVHRESFRGLFVPLLRRRLEGETRRRFEGMNRALKGRAEPETS
jgi:hypothetical protein